MERGARVQGAQASNHRQGSGVMVAHLGAEAQSHQDTGVGAALGREEEAVHEVWGGHQGSKEVHQEGEEAVPGKEVPL